MLVAVYVYNITVLPLYTGEQVSFLLINVVSFLNLGLAGFVVAAIAARFVFPAMSIEGRMMWLLRSSPIDVRTIFWSKYWVGTVPLLLVALPLIVGTNHRSRRVTVHPGADLGDDGRSHLRAHGARARLRGALPELRHGERRGDSDVVRRTYSS